MSITELWRGRRYWCGISAIPKTLAMLAVLLVSSGVNAAKLIEVPASILLNSEMPFESHRGEGLFDTALAMNIQYAPVKKVRENLSRYLQYPLRYFTGWNEAGEAHITVITPPEYRFILEKFIKIEKIEEIALKNHIQQSEIKVLGLGRGQARIQNKEEETFFLTVQSENLLKIRRQIYQEFVKNGARKDAWDPDHFYPHITVGYSRRDLHEADGVIKDVAQSRDKRFEVSVAR
ncbi:hypothetical protein Lgee_1121 [Legionella geestiana]|uniref:Swiss Army Knife 2H phosphoesterase domain-containing protein n=2 Tax=Legionella geestiana TaxID=45065 RepID=A0A0W0TX13_9GAMM|nr:2'-5' RNA ligase family protein [Legionella geestiana]KTC99866.1 hypothetical protein Lgee_1121 [Legionella geestiana]QBS13248.1 hypothetical protein E4T54_11115 [Legionella geestiana]STX54228.1 Uncharacterised protein [Legionella geestiana]